MRAKPFVLILLGVLLAAAGCQKPAETPSPSPAKQATPAPRKVLFYRNPIDPSVTSPVPAKDGMGMDYVPVYAAGADEPAGSAGRVSAADGLAPVPVGAEGLRLAGVQTAVAERQTLHRATRAAGLVVPDETRVRHVQTRLGLDTDEVLGLLRTGRWAWPAGLFPRGPVHPFRPAAVINTQFD